MTSGKPEFNLDNIFRLLGFENGGRFVVLTNGFAKKTQKTPKKEINLARNEKKSTWRIIQNE